MNSRYASYLEKVLTSDASAATKKTAFTRFYMTLIHETAHELNKFGKVAGQNTNGQYLYTKIPGGFSQEEQGYKAESYIWGYSGYAPSSNQSSDKSDKGIEGIGSEKYQPGVTEGVIKEAEKTSDGRSSLPTVPNQ